MEAEKTHKPAMLALEDGKLTAQSGTQIKNEDEAIATVVSKYEQLLNSLQLVKTKVLKLQGAKVSKDA